MYTTLKQEHYEALQETILRQIEKIKELERLKANLLDENQSMSNELKRIETCVVTNPQDLIDEANKQL